MGSPISVMFSLVNHFQLLLLIPMLGAYMPSNVIIFLQGLKMAMFSFDTQFIKSYALVNDAINTLNFTQPNIYLLRIDFDSGSTIVNHVYPIISVVVCIIIQCIL